MEQILMKFTNKEKLKMGQGYIYFNKQENVSVSHAIYRYII
jgi:hypothetical protein